MLLLVGPKTCQDVKAIA